MTYLVHSCLFTWAKARLGGRGSRPAGWAWRGMRPMRATVRVLGQRWRPASRGGLTRATWSWSTEATELLWSMQGSCGRRLEVTGKRRRRTWRGGAGWQERPDPRRERRDAGGAWSIGAGLEAGEAALLGLRRQRQTMRRGDRVSAQGQQRKRRGMEAGHGPGEGRANPGGRGAIYGLHGNFKRRRRQINTAASSCPWQQKR